MPRKSKIYSYSLYLRISLNNKYLFSANYYILNFISSMKCVCSSILHVPRMIFGIGKLKIKKHSWKWCCCETYQNSEPNTKSSTKPNKECQLQRQPLILSIFGNSFWYDWKNFGHIRVIILIFMKVFHVKNILLFIIPADKLKK